MTWSQLELQKPHIAYACVGIFSTIFSLLSLFVKERLYIGEATVASIAGLILGPHCLGWFEPTTWGNTDYITLEICRIVLCIQIVAVAVELPKKYMQKHWLSVTIFLLPVMTCGWLVVGLFIWVLIPHFNFSSALLVSACVTATDPVLAAAVVGKGKFAERVPGHLRNLLSAESGCNDGMAFPFIYLSLNLVLHPGNAREIVKDWFLLTILWECIFGCLLGAFIGFVLKYAVAYAEKKGLIDRESFLAIFVFLAFNSAGIGSMLGVDDLLVSFAAGTAFGWDGEFAKKTEESHVSTVIDLLLNLSFFVYFGAIIPWPQFNDASLGLNCWRLIVLAIVIIFLRRLPAVVALKPFTPDVKTWREAFFCGHFGPIGVGAIFAAILARGDLESHYTHEETPLAEIPTHDFPHTQLIAVIWPIVCFIVITSIIVHGSSVAVLTLGKRLNRMAITMSFTTTNTHDQGPAWMSRLQKLDKASTSFSLHRVDTQAPPVASSSSSSTQVEKEGDSNADPGKLPQSNTVETSGIKVRPAGGAKRRKHKKKKRGSRLKKSLSKATSHDDRDQLYLSPTTERQRPQAEFLQLGRSPSRVTTEDDQQDPEQQQAEHPEHGSPTSTTGKGTESEDGRHVSTTNKEESTATSDSSESIEVDKDEESNQINIKVPESQPNDPVHSEKEARQRSDSIPTAAYQEGSQIIIEDQHGEIVETIPMKGDHGSKKTHANFDSGERSPHDKSKPERAASVSIGNLLGRGHGHGHDGDAHGDTSKSGHGSTSAAAAAKTKSKETKTQGTQGDQENMSLHSMDSLSRHMSQYSYSGTSDNSESSSQDDSHSIGRKLSRTFSGGSKRRAFHKKNDPERHKVYAHQVDDLIVIENDEGEVIRRYKVNRHFNPNKQRSRSNTLVGKALSLVGIKNKDDPAASGAAQQGNNNIPSINVTGDQDSTTPQNILVKEHDSQKANNPMRNEKLESRIENKLTDILTKGQINPKGKPSTQIAVPQNDLAPPRPASGRRHSDIAEEESENDSNESQDSEGSEDDDSEDDSEEEDLQETEVEKRRRLAALGQLSSRRDANDEEE